MVSGRIIPFAFDLSMAATVFGYGLHAKTEDVFYLLRKPRLLILSLLAMFIITPMTALMITQGFAIPLAAKVAMVALALSPVSPVLPKTERSAGGNESYAVGLAFTVILLSIVIVPALVVFLGRLMGRPFVLAPFDVAKVVLAVALAPLVAGMIFDWFWPDIAARISTPIAKASNVLLFVLIVLVFIPAARIVLGFISAGAIVAFAGFNIAALGVGHIMGGPERDHSVVLALSCASSHPAIALAIATANYPNEKFAAAIMLCVTVNLIVSFPYIVWHRLQTTVNA